MNGYDRQPWTVPKKLESHQIWNKLHAIPIFLLELCGYVAAFFVIMGIQIHEYHFQSKETDALLRTEIKQKRDNIVMLSYDFDCPICKTEGFILHTRIAKPGVFLNYHLIMTIYLS